MFWGSVRNGSHLDNVEENIGQNVIWLWVRNGQSARVLGYLAGRRGHVCYVDTAGFTHYVHVQRVVARWGIVSDISPRLRSQREVVENAPSRRS